MGEETPRSQKSFRRLVRLLPFDFRTKYQGEMEALFREQQLEVEQQGGFWGTVRLWAETIAGIFTTAPREHWEILKSDFAYAYRMVENNPGFTSVAVLTLALGIGVNSAIFSVVHSVLLRPLPYTKGEQLLFLRQEGKKIGNDDMAFSVKEIQDYREQSHTLANLAEYHSMSFTLFGHGDPERVRTGVVSTNYFEMFGIKPLLGRAFLPADEQLGAPAVLILSHEYWKTVFGGYPDIIGKTFEMNDRVYTVVGVLPPVPQYPDENDVYMPTSACPFRASKQALEHRDHRMMQVFARVKPGVSLETARADVAAIAKNLSRTYPEAYPENIGYTIEANQLRHELTHQARPTLLVLVAAAAFVLLIACANVANLTLSRMARRERELALRTALGAGRSRLLRQLLTESFLLALLGGALGLLLADGSLQLLTAFAARLTPRAREIQLDKGVLLFTLVIALGTSVVFGTLSALFSRVNLNSSLKESSLPIGSGHRQSRMRSALIVCQVALSFVLLIGAGLMLRSLFKMQKVDTGLVAQRVLALRTTYNWSKYAFDKDPSGQKLKLVNKTLLERVRDEPGVLSAAVSSRYPFDPEFIQAGAAGVSFTFQVEGRTLLPGEAPPSTTFALVSTDYFRTLGIPLKAGRLFTEHDDLQTPVIMINEMMKNRLWPHADPIGKRISADGEHWATIVGVVGDVREFGVDRPPAPEAYAPQTVQAQPGALLVRTAVDPMSMSKEITHLIHEVDPQTAVTHVTTLEQSRYESMASPRLTANLLGIFGGLALIIATAGIGGIMALSVSQRVREIGIRMSLGATPSNIIRHVLGEGLLLAGLGIVIGVGGALALANLVKSMLFEVPPTDVITFTGVAIVLTGAALFASYLPARRAAGVDPNQILRAE